MKNDEFRIIEFNRRKQADFFGTPVFIVSAEDLLLSKLIWIQQLQSSIQRKILKVLAGVSTLDKTYVNFWIDKLNLDTFGLLQ